MSLIQVFQWICFVYTRNSKFYKSISCKSWDHSKCSCWCIMHYNSIYYASVYLNQNYICTIKTRFNLKYFIFLCLLFNSLFFLYFSQSLRVVWHLTYISTCYKSWQGLILLFKSGDLLWSFLEIALSEF